MQVATNPFSAHHYHSYYQLPPPDYDLKRQYLALLPPQQIIEICLTFDIHVPPHVKSTVWPQDLNAAIAVLQKPPQSRVAEAANTTEKPARDVMNSLKSPPPHSPSETPESAPVTKPQPPDRNETSSPAPSSQPAPPTPESAKALVKPAEGVPPSSTVSETTETLASVSVTQPTPTAQPPAPQPSQPPQHPVHPQYPTAYAYAHPQATYPHAPYYTSHPGPYSYPYASYQPMPTTYPQAPPGPYPPQAAMYSNMMAVQHPPQHEGVAADDLPSYEEMIVEALTGCADPEGWAPKDLFSWMASRYPLQQNFRPSASQALQKAFKRGRFEKSSNGKYRLNATWNGGNTSRRTTRRPQTQNSQTTSGSSAPAPPFTNTPLVHHHHTSITSTHPPVPTSAQPTYPTPPYGYSYTPVGYPGYPAQQPHASTSTAQGTISGTQAPNAATADATRAAAPSGPDSDTDAAYEAAKNILSAINFSNLYQMASEEQGDTVHGNDQPNDQSTAGMTGVEELLSHVQAAMQANAEHNAASSFNAQMHQMGDMPEEAAQPQSPGDPRAELQAQLALLAAQLAEHAKLEDAEVVLPMQPVPQMQQQHAQQPKSTPMSAPAPAPMAILSPPSPPSPPPPVVAPTHDNTVPADVAHMPQAIPEEDEESDDDDMEEVI